MGLVSLQHRRWYRKLSYFHKFYIYEYTQYFFRSIPMRSSGYITGGMQNIFFFKTKQEFLLGTLSFHQISLNGRILLKNEETKPFPMFLETEVLWKLSVSCELSDHLLPYGVFHSHNPKGIRFTARLPLGLSHFQNHKFRHIFQNLLQKICNVLLHFEATSYYLFH